MKRLFFCYLLVLALASSISLPLGASAPPVGGQPSLQAVLSSQPRYTVTDLGTLGGDTSQAFGINNEGGVAGQAKLSAQIHHAFVWDGETMADLGTLGGPLSSATDINDAGQAAGVSHTGSSTRAFLWQNDSMQNLGALGGSSSGAYGINNNGQVVGYATDTTQLQRAFLWQNGSMQDLGTLGGAQSHAYDLNDAAQVVGWAYVAGDDDPPFHAFLWQNGSMQDLGTLGGHLSQALAINGAGQVVGWSHLANWREHAFLWQNGSMQDLGSLGGDWSLALDINDAGQVVGNARNAASQNRAFLWENGTMKDLNNLIAADSGWALVSAEAINRRGQIVGFGVINGQTHAFLLTPLAYYWHNPNGGAWHTTTNWDPQGDPAAGDTTIFALAGEYTVDASQLPAARLSASSFALDRMVISATTTVNFNNLNLNLVYDSPIAPSLQVNDGGTANLNSGVTTFSHAILGGLLPADPDNPPTARLQVFNSGTTLTGSGRLTIGDLGVGDLFVANGGQLTSAETRLGGEQPGTAVVGGDGSRWQTGNIAVGYGVSSTLTIENGGRVDSNTAVVGFGSGSFPSVVTVEGDSSLWAVEGGLTLGQGATGFVDVLNGGQLVVNQSVSILDGLLKLAGSSANGAPALLVVMDSLLVEGKHPESGDFSMYNGARGDVYGDFIVGQGGAGNVFLFGAPGAPAALSVIDSLSGACLIGREYAGNVSVSEYSSLSCRNVQLGLAGATGHGQISLYGGFLNVNEIVRVGQVGSGGGELELLNATVTVLEGMHIAPNGRVSGSGNIILGSAGLLNEGSLSPGINIVPVPLAAAPTMPQVDPATLTITGTLTLSPTGQLEIPLVGSASGQYGSLAVNGAANLDGVLALDFRDGYTPRQGDAFTLLAATSGVAGAFDSVEISGMLPGFQYELTIVDGQLVLEALNNGISAAIYLPLVTTRP